MKKRITSYTFDASEKTIAFAAGLEIEGFLLIVNVVDNIIIYNFADATTGGTYAADTLTLAYNTTSMSDSDELLIYYDDGLTTQAVSGTITAELSATDNAVLDEIKIDTEAIETAVEAIQAAQLPDGHNVTVDNASLTVDTGLTQPLTDTQLRATAVPVSLDISSLATAANQQTDALTDTELRATPVPVSGSVTVDLGANNDVTVTSGAITETNSGAIKTAVETIDNAISGSEMQVDVVTMPTTTVQATNLDIRDLSQATDGVAIYGSDDGGTTKRLIKTDAGGAIQVDLEVAGVTVDNVTIDNESGAAAVNIQDGGNSITVDGSLTVDLGANNDVTVTSGSVTANAGTNLNTSALALETGGNLASIKTNTDKIPALGQALAAGSVPVVLTAAQLSTLTPPAAITGFATSAKQDTIIGHVDGIETVLGTIDTDTGNIVTSVQLLDNAVDGNYLNTNMNIAGTDVAGGNGTTSAQTQRVTISSDSTGQVKLAAGTNAIGKLAANSGVDIGDVDVLSLPDSGQSIFRSIDLDESEEAVKATAGTLYGWYLYNNSSATLYMKLYNATVASVTVGTTTPVMTVPVPAGSAANVSFNGGITFGTAITAAVTTGVADNNTGAPSANDFIANIFYK